MAFTLLQVYMVPGSGAVEDEVTCCEEGDENPRRDAEANNLGVGKAARDAQHCCADDEQVHHKPQGAPFVHQVVKELALPSCLVHHEIWLTRF